MPIKGWTWQEKQTIPIYKYEKGKNFKRKCVKKDDLQKGMKVIVYGLSGWYKATVTSLSSNEGAAETEGLIWPLQYDEEEECWGYTACMNKEALKTVTACMNKEALKTVGED